MLNTRVAIICMLRCLWVGLDATTSAAGLEVYKDEEPGTLPDGSSVNKTVFTCGGKLLVLDMTFEVLNTLGASSSSLPETTTSSPSRSPITLVSLHLTHDPPGEDKNPQSERALAADAYLPIMLSNCIEHIIQTSYGSVFTTTTLNSNIASQGPIVPNARRVALLLDAFRSCLEQLVLLDDMANDDPENGTRWLREVGALSDLAEAVWKDEVNGLADPKALDSAIGLGHPLPLPHIFGPSLSFLAGLSPRAYLSLLRDKSAPEETSSSGAPAFAGTPLDISYDRLRRLISSHAFDPATSDPINPSFRPSSGQSWDTLFTLGTLIPARRPLTAASQNVVVAQDFNSNLSPKYPLLGPQTSVPDKDAMDVDSAGAAPNVTLQKFLSYTLPPGETATTYVEWTLDLESIATSREDSTRGHGIWLPQSATHAISRIVGIRNISVFEGFGDVAGRLQMEGRLDQFNVDLNGSGRRGWADELVSRLCR